ncbi:hypothetical protein [Streptococcus catagoni]|uniref:hypothetical protein n=1 Tax=Streptococcus catagoni TaxID=2654874 RepID=UPI00140A1551|nr:hypothetical protein [Streptococcus catagoni]
MRKNIIAFSIVFIVFVAGIYTGYQFASNDYQQQISGLQKQIDRCHEQLAKKTARIAELTGNGG